MPDSEISLRLLLPLYDGQDISNCVDLRMKTIVPDYFAQDIKKSTGVFTIFFDELYSSNMDLQIPQVIYSSPLDKGAKWPYLRVEIKAYNEEGYKGKSDKHNLSICFEERSNIYDPSPFVSQMANFRVVYHWNR
jgi:hypothetical protein